MSLPSFMTFYKHKKLFAWCLYDWGNSALATIIFTFIFAVYFSRNVVGDETLGSSYWGYTVGLSGLIIAFIGPILGAITDTYGPKKSILGGLTALTILSTTALFFAMPAPEYIFYALFFVCLTTIGFELAQAQYNAMLHDIAPTKIIGKISAIAWAMGYLGGLICLIIALGGFIGVGDNNGLLNFPTNDDFNIRATCILAALWYAVFAAPLFFYVPETPKNNYKHPLFKTALQNLGHTLRSLTNTSKNILRFLIASAIYRDGLNTLFAVGGLYAAGTFNMNFQDILIFAVGLSLTSAIGSFISAFFDDKYGSKNVIIASLICLIILGVGIVLSQDKMTFLIISLILGLFIGPVQSSSRTFMAKLSPKNQSAELFGLYAMTGKSIAFTGPLLFAFLTQVTNNQRWGICAIILLWIIGLILIKPIKEN